MLINRRQWYLNVVSPLRNAMWACLCYICLQIWLSKIDLPLIFFIFGSYGTPPLGTYTMFDVFFASKEAVKVNLNENLHSLDLMGLATVAAEEAALRTRKSSEDHPDPGAHSIGIWMRAVYECFKLRSTIFEDVKID